MTASTFSGNTATAVTNDSKNSAQLVYFPPKVNPERLKSNGKLLSDAEIIRAYDFLKDFPSGRYSKMWLYRNGIFDNNKFLYGLVKDENGTIFAIYNEYSLVPHAYRGLTLEGKEVEISSGGFGKVKYVQKHERSVNEKLPSDTWYLLKTIKQHFYDTYTAAPAVLREATSLYAVGQADHATVIERSKKAIMKRNILMKYARGKELFHIVSDAHYNDQPFLLRLRIVIQVLQAYQKIFNNGYLHRDLKLDNIIFDFFMGATIIDVGAATKYSDIPSGKPQKFEINAIGAIFYAVLFNLPSQYLSILATRSLSEIAERWGNNRTYQYIQTNPEIVAYLSKMRLDEDNRPDLDDVVTFFSAYEKQYVVNHPDEVEEVKAIYDKLKSAEETRLKQFSFSQNTASTTNLSVPLSAGPLSLSQEKENAEVKDAAWNAAVKIGKLKITIADEEAKKQMLREQEKMQQEEKAKNQEMKQEKIKQLETQLDEWRKIKETLESQIAEQQQAKMRSDLKVLQASLISFFHVIYGKDFTKSLQGEVQQINSVLTNNDGSFLLTQELCSIAKKYILKTQFKGNNYPSSLNSEFYMQQLYGLLIKLGAELFKTDVIQNVNQHIIELTKEVEQVRIRARATAAEILNPGFRFFQQPGLAPSQITLPGTHYQTLASINGK
jgi:hypothetical protein